MKKTNRENLPVWSAVYGVKPNTVIDSLENLMTSVALNAGWFELLFGLDTSQRGFLYVQTLKDSFWLNATPRANSKARKSRCSFSWVYAIDGLPVEFYKNGYEPTVLTQGGFDIAYGSDARDRQFLHVKAQASNINLLFRDPASDCTSAWNPLRAEVVVAMGTQPVAPKKHETPCNLEVSEFAILKKKLGLDGSHPASW